MTEGPTTARMRCRDIMTSDVRTATRDMTLQQVAVLLRDGDMGSMPVVEGGKLVGIVTDRDLAPACRASVWRPVAFLRWVGCEAAVIACVRAGV